MPLLSVSVLSACSSIEDYTVSHYLKPVEVEHQALAQIDSIAIERDGELRPIGVSIFTVSDSVVNDAQKFVLGYRGQRETMARLQQSAAAVCQALVDDGKIGRSKSNRCNQLVGDYNYQSMKFLIEQRDKIKQFGRV